MSNQIFDWTIVLAGWADWIELAGWLLELIYFSKLTGRKNCFWSNWIWSRWWIIELGVTGCIDGLDWIFWIFCTRIFWCHKIGVGFQENVEEKIDLNLLLFRVSQGWVEICASKNLKFWNFFRKILALWKIGNFE